MGVRMSKEETARREGMAYAVRIAREKGIEGLEDEYKRRALSIAPMGLPDRELRIFSERVKEATYDTVCILACAALRDAFGFGQKRLMRFKEEFLHKCEFIAAEDVTWQDWVITLKEETGIDFDLRLNNDNVTVKRPN